MNSSISSEHVRFRRLSLKLFVASLITALFSILMIVLAFATAGAGHGNANESRLLGVIGLIFLIVTLLSLLISICTGLRVWIKGGLSVWWVVPSIPMFLGLTIFAIWWLQG